jgi:hypothetical protein
MHWFETLEMEIKTSDVDIWILKCMDQRRK